MAENTDITRIRQELEDGIKAGRSYQSLKEAYPLLSEAAYKKLGGIIPLGPQGLQPGYKASMRQAMLLTKEESLMSDAEKLFTWARSAPPAGVSAETVMYRSLFGDGHIDKGPSPTYIEAHSFAQLSYVWSKAAALGDKLSSMHLAPKHHLGPERDAIVYLSSTTCHESQKMRDLFYPSGKKDVLNPKVYDNFDWGTLAWWLMDDGGRYNANGVSITVATMPHYNEHQARNAAGIMSEILGVRISLGVADDCYDFRLSSNRDLWLPQLLPHMLPALAYKLGVRGEQCGSLWPTSYLTGYLLKLSTIEHPHLVGRTFDSFFENDEQKAVLRRACYSKMRSCGFPYPRPDRKATTVLYLSLEKQEAKVSPRGILAPTQSSTISTPYFPNRFHVRVGKSGSLYSAYCKESLIEGALDSYLGPKKSISQHSLLNALNYHKCRLPTMFNPLWAKYLVSRYNTQNGRVLDPCAGWGGRMIGARLAGAQEYVGLEVEEETRKGLHQLLQDLPESRSISTIIDASAEEPSSYQGLGEFSMGITCPPYFNYETYSTSPRQSSERFRTYDAWLAGFMLPMLRGVLSVLAPGGAFVLVVGDVEDRTLVEDTTVLAESLGYSLEEVLPLLSPNSRTDTYSDKALILRRPTECSLV